VWAGVGIRRSSGGRCWIWSRPAGRWVDVAWDLGISAQSIYTWRRQDRIDKGIEPGLTSSEKAELTAAKRRITELETELAIHRRASELLGKVVPPKGGSRPSR
jgi:transposase